MSTKTPARLEDSGNDDSNTDDTTAAEPNPLGEQIAEVAPYATNRFHNDR